MIKTELTCPLGSKCEEIKDDVLHRCAWYTKVVGQKPDGEQVDEWGCAIAWMPTLQLEMAKTNRGQTAAIESLRNGTFSRQDKALELINVTNT